MIIDALFFEELENDAFKMNKPLWRNRQTQGTLVFRAHRWETAVWMLSNSVKILSA